MPPSILYYNGITVSYYSNEHDPIHVHAFYAGKEYGMRVEFQIRNGKIIGINYKQVPGVKPLRPAQKKDLEKMVTTFKNEIVEGWIDYFIKHVKPKFRIINKL